MPTPDRAIRDNKAWLGYVQQDGLVVSPTALVDVRKARCRWRTLNTTPQ